MASEALAGSGPVLSIQGVAKRYRVSRGIGRPPGAIRAVDGVSFDLGAGETIGLVGESGCGKSTLAKMILGSETPTEGRVLWHGTAVAAMDAKQRHQYRAAVQAVFQDPTSSLNPRMRAGTLIAEPLRIHKKGDDATIDARVGELLDAVGLASSARRSFPHELSGGMRQRIAIARALALDPEILVLDEPVSSLDVSVRAQIMNLLKGLRHRYSFSCLLIAHDLASVRYMVDRVIVMYLGTIVEEGPVDKVFGDPEHPYTQALIEASLSVKPRAATDKATRLQGELPSPLSPPSGCRLHGRCPFAFERCSAEVPLPHLVDVGHRVACHLVDPANVVTSRASQAAGSSTGG